MGDLIDLSGSGSKSNKSPELPKPLIPVPESVQLNDAQQSQQQVLDFVPLAPRKSLENNPFDMMLHKASEYVNKSEDPFEIVYEKAKTADDNKRIDFADDCLSKMKKYSDILKGDINLVGSPRRKSIPSIFIQPETPINNSLIFNNSAKDNFNFEQIPSSPATCDLSILNQSAMNDSLSSSEEGFLKSIVAHRISMCIRKGTMDAEMMDIEKPTNDRLHKLRRSVSLGDEIISKDYKKHETNTIIGNLHNSILEDEEMPTTFFDDTMNQAFLLHVKDNGVSDNSCNISAINRKDSATSSVGSTLNRGFVDQTSLYTNSLRIRGSAGSNISDLISQYNHLKKKSANSLNSTDYASMVDDEFYTTAQTSDQLANTTSDSVFIKNDSGKKTILNEANSLAQKFEELASSLGSTDNSSSNEMLPNRLPNNSGASIELDVVTDDLIKLQPSPVKSSTEINNSPMEEKSSSNEKDNKLDTCNKIKELETELLGPEKKIEAATLLMNLENLVKTQNNTEAADLLGKLEKVLGVNCQNNTELLSLCLQDNSSLSENSNEGQSEKNSIGNSRDENMHVISNEKIENTSCEGNMNLEESIKNSDKSGNMKEKIQNADTNQNLVMDIKLALDQLLARLNGEPAVLLQNLNKVLNPDVKSHENNSESPIKSISSSPRKSGVPYRSVKSLSRQSMDSNTKIKPLDSLLKRRTFTPQINKSPSASIVKTRIDSPKKEIKRRQNSSDPGAINSLKQQISEPALKMKTSLPVITRFPKKGNEAPNKKGPLKAVIPLGSMQRGNSFIKKSTQTTPKKSPRRISTNLKIMTSTPAPNIPMTINCQKSSPKIKPVASSTPIIGGKTWSTEIRVPQSPRHSTSWNISPVTPNAPISLSDESLKSTKCQRRVSTDSPRSQTPTKPRKFERSMTKVLNKSLLPSSSSNTPIKKTNKNLYSRVSEPLQKKDPKIVVASPLKDSNGSAKVKIFNSISKLRRGSVGSQKENKLN